MAHIMTTKEISRYLKLHEIAICKYAAAGIIPGSRIGRMWRFDKDAIDDWISAGQNDLETHERGQKESAKGNSGRQKPTRRKV